MVWDKIEEANFPIKLGGSYTWGKDADAWDFDFYPAEEFKDEPRPAKFIGQRQRTAFQVERGAFLNGRTEMYRPERVAQSLQVDRAAARVRRGPAPDPRLVPEWREVYEDVVWSLINSPEFVWVP